MAFDRAPTFFSELIDTLAERGRALLNRTGTRGVAHLDLTAMAELLLSRKGEASGVALAETLLASYEAAAPENRLAFLRSLTQRFGPDAEELLAAIDAYAADPSPDAVSALHRAAEPRRQELIRRLNLAPGGTAALVRMRADILAETGRHPALGAVDADFAHLFSSWFNRGFLVLRPIDWTTPANILEKIIRYEAVHAIQDWDDLRNRVEPADRRCYGFFHPQLTDEPLIFVEVALTREIPAAIEPLLDLTRSPIAATDATTAVFYSISNTQKGLGGITFGNFLIKQVVENLTRELPNLKTFVTLSPVPGFAAWLAKERAAEESNWLGEGLRDALRRLDEPDWAADEAANEALRPALLAAAAQYFLNAKNAAGRPVDPVARFHLGNGARLERLNWLGDRAAKGLRQSHGLMVNYLYAPEEIEKNHEAFAERGVVAASPAVRRLLPGKAAGPALAPAP